VIVARQQKRRSIFFGEQIRHLDEAKELNMSSKIDVENRLLEL
jgi:hypothetical protein